ncbi:MAG: hypothetical protein ACYTGI_21285 [Planctomycetota bacterium]
MPARKKTSRSKQGAATRRKTRPSGASASRTRTSKERRPVPKKKSPSISSLDIDRVVREEVTEWFTSNRKGLETVFRGVAEQVREELDELWKEQLDEEREKFQLEIRKYAEENAQLRERLRNTEEEIKRLRSIVGMVRNQVAEESMD